MNGYARVAERQFGLVTRDQLLSLEFSESAIDRRLAAGSLLAVFPGVYRIPGAPVTAHQRALAATLWVEPDGVVSHATAGRLLHLDAVPRPSSVDLLVPDRRRPRSMDVRVRQSISLPRIDRVTVDGIPCTSATRTVIDLAAALDEESLEAAFESARRMGLSSPAHLARRFEELGGSGRAGSRALRRLIEVATGSDRALESKLEVKLARLIRASDLPKPVRQHPIAGYRVDFAYPDRWLGIEADGFDWHGNRLQWKRDRRRVAEIEALGWRLVFVTWDDVTKRPEQTLHRIDLALAASTWAEGRGSRSRVNTPKGTVKAFSHS